MDQTASQSSAAKWYMLVAVIIVIAALWYFYGKQAPTENVGPATAEQTQTTSGGATADILVELNQISDDTASLAGEEAASAEAIQGF